MSKKALLEESEMLVQLLEQEEAANGQLFQEQATESQESAAEEN